MTMSIESNRKEYSGDGSTTTFPFTFKIWDTGDIEVYVVDALGVQTPKVEGTDYDVTTVNNDWSAGGNVEMAAAPASGERLVLLRAIQQTQESDYLAGDTLPSEQFESDLDKVVAMVQELEEKIDRAITVPASDLEIISREIETAEVRKGKYLYFDAATGKPMVTTFTDPGITISAFWTALLDDIDLTAWVASIGIVNLLTALGITAFIQTLLDDASASVALTTLGISTFIKTLLDDADAAAARATLGAFGISTDDLDDIADGTNNVKLNKTTQTIAGLKTFDDGFVVDNRTDDPGSPVTGQMWFRTNV